MGKLIKMSLRGYDDSKLTKHIWTFDAQINPDSLKLTREISYAKDKNQAMQEKQSKFDSQKPSSLSFNIVLDDTGVAPEAKGKIKDRINLLEKTLFLINSETHEPSYVRLLWGDFTFQGRLKTLSYDYTMFAPDGSPLRVKVSLGFVSHMDIDVEKSKIKRKSPDLSRIIVLKSGESIASWCNEIYGDASYCFEIARENNLAGFRNVKPGTELMFPPLKRNGRITE